MPSNRLPIIGYPLTPSILEGVVSATLAEVANGPAVERWERRPHELAGALAELRDGPDYLGALVASPHKEKAPPLTDWLSDDARLSGAVNVIARVDGRLRGHNTDVDGVRAGLTALLPRVKGKWPRNAVVLGAGAGARACVTVLIGSGFQHVSVLNRHLHRAEALVAHFGRSARHMELRARPWHDAIIEVELARAELLVNASGVGTDAGDAASGVGTDAGDAAIATELIPADRYVLDLVLNRPATALMDAVQAQGGKAANGQAAFLASTAVTIELLTGRAPAPDSLRSALAAELGVPLEGVASMGD